MYTIEDTPGAIPTVEFLDTDARTRAVLAPSRGGMLTHFQIAGRDLLYLDRKTFDDPAANVRGGNPVLFPSPGKLTADTWAWGSARGSMKQHGFARSLPWQILDRASSTSDGASVRLRLASSDITRAQYPWDFRADYTYTLRANTLRIDLEVTNESHEGMPFGAGFHPYFAVPDPHKPRAEIATHATRAFDNVQKREVALSTIDLTLPEVDLHLLDHGSTESALTLAPLQGHPGTRISLRGSPEFTRWVVWTLKGKDFVCLEPWTCPGDALNTGAGLILLQPGATRSLFLQITAEPAPRQA